MSTLDPRALALRLWKIHGGDQHGPHIETLVMPLDRFDGFVDALSAALSQPQAGEPVAALEPFTTFAANNTEKTDDGWQWTGCSRDRICDWFGPSDFGLLLHFAPALCASPQPALAVKGRLMVEEIAAEATAANDVIRLKRANEGQGKIRVATALHRIEKLAYRIRSALVASQPPSGEVEALRKAATRLLAAFDELQSTTTAERIMTGRSDATLRKESNEAISDLRAALRDDGDEEACVVCDEHLEAGDLVYWSSNDDGHMHASCATSYVDENGNNTDTPPKPLVFRPLPAAPTATGGR